jgi:hypothetical protein
MFNNMKRVPNSKTYIFKKVRVSRLFTRILGPLYNTKYDFIEIDLTYDCNLKCLNCNRSCRQASSKEEMSVFQVKKFIDESVKSDRKWKGIRIIGGEPTLHKNVVEIAKIISDYKKFSPKLSLRFATNGCSNKNIVDMIPSEFIIENSHKTTVSQYFTPINLAPIDLAAFNSIDFRNACPITKLCGLGLTKYGYYHCAVAGAIDRVFGFDLGRKSLPAIGDQMIKEKRELCKYCGHFLEYFGVKKTNKELISKSWIKSYNNYKESQFKLSEY